MKQRLPYLLALLAIVTLACSVSVTIQSSSPTLPPPAVSTTLPTPTRETPLLPPPLQPAPTPTPDNCQDPAVNLYLKAAEELLWRYSGLTTRFQTHLDAGDKAAMEADMADIHSLTDEIAALTPPPLYRHYHDLFRQEVHIFTDILSAVLADNTALAVALAAEVNATDGLRLEEARRIQKYCYPSNSGLNAQRSTNHVPS